MKIYIVGVGTGSKDMMTKQALLAIENSDCIIGAPRMLDCFADRKVLKFRSSYSDEMVAYIKSNPQLKTISVVVSGDVGFFSAAKKLVDLLEGYDVTLVCGISSIVYFCSKLKTSWDDIKIVSVHGRDNNVIGSIMTNNKTFILTGGKQKTQDICKMLCECGLGDVVISVGENLSYDNERITTKTARELINDCFDDLSVMLVYNENSFTRKYITHGIPDEEFIRGEVPMTKCEVRSVSISKLRLKQNDICYDIGAGTGSVAVEMALLATDGFVYAVEKDPDALALLEENKKKFGTYNLKIIDATAPDGLDDLPAPDRVFIGGSSGNMAEIFEMILVKNPKARIVVNAITLETVSETLSCFEKCELIDVDIVQMSVAKSKKISAYNMMMGQNPVYIFSGQGA